MDLRGGTGRFYDLRLEAGSQSSSLLQNMLDRAAMLGYSCVALNFHWNPGGGSDLSDDKEQLSKKKRKKAIPNIPDPDSLKYTIPKVQATGDPLKVLKRLTVKLEDTSNLHLLNRPDVKKFDIFAVTPTNTDTFLQACTTLSVDVIGIDYECYKRGMIHLNHYRLAVRRGVVFELTYSPLLGTDSLRRRVISIAYLISSIQKAKGILISSGASHHHQLRSPRDVPYLGCLFSMSEQIIRAGISSLPESVTIRAYGRLRLGGRGMEVIFKDDTKSQQESGDQECCDANGSAVKRRKHEKTKSFSVD